MRSWNPLRCPFVVKAGREADPLTWDSYLDPDVRLDGYALIRAMLDGDPDAAELLLRTTVKPSAVMLMLARFAAMGLAEHVGYARAGELLDDATARTLAEAVEAQLGHYDTHPTQEETQ